jgi:hypothetical protein
MELRSERVTTVPEGDLMVDRRKKPVATRLTALEAIQVLLKKEEIRTANKVLRGIYRKGWSANQEGRNRSINPYPRETPYWEEWNRGWIECSKVIKRRQSDNAFATS